MWLERRREGIGGSDAPAILGLVGWASPTSVQADKWGLLDEPTEAEHLRWGRRLESAIIEGLAEETGLPLRPYQKLLRSTRWPFMLCTPDAYAEGKVWAQTKNTMKAEDWQEQPPPYVWVQCQHEMAVTGMQRMLAAALIFGNRLRWAIIERDEAFIAETLIPAEREFWRLTELREPAPADASEHTRKALQALYPQDSGETVQLDGSFLDLDAERAELEAQIKEAKARKDWIENQIRRELGTATFGVLANGTRYSLKTQHRKAYDVKESSFRVLRRLKAKEAL